MMTKEKIMEWWHEHSATICGVAGTVIVYGGLIGGIYAICKFVPREKLEEMHIIYAPNKRNLFPELTEYSELWDDIFIGGETKIADLGNLGKALAEELNIPVDGTVPSLVIDLPKN